MEIYRGLILAQRNAGDRGKFVDILTEMNTVQEVYVRGAKKLDASATSVTQLFSYARFSVQKRGNQYYLDSAEPIKVFYRLRESLSRLSLAMYFAELVRLSVREFRHPGEQSEVLRLLLNTLHYLEGAARSETMLKSIFEMRLMVELGMAPNLLICRSCGAFLPEKLLFFVGEAGYCCAGCDPSGMHSQSILIHAPTLQAMRHLVFADWDRLYNFRLGQLYLAELSTCTEQFVRYHLGFRFETLQFYHKITTTDMTQQLEDETDEQASPDTGIS